MSRKTVTIEVGKEDVAYLVRGAKVYLGPIVPEYDGRETFRFLIELDEFKRVLDGWSSES